jgi:hypothetical protein
MSSRLVCLLVDCQQYSECYCVEDGTFVSFVDFWRKMNDKNFEYGKRT